MYSQSWCTKLPSHGQQGVLLVCGSEIHALTRPPVDSNILLFGTQLSEYYFLNMFMHDTTGRREDKGSQKPRKPKDPKKSVKSWKSTIQISLVWLLRRST